MKTKTIMKADDPDLREAQDRAVKHWKSSGRLARRTLEEAWRCGQALAEVREKLPHGGWMAWLHDVDIRHETVRRLIRLSEAYEIPQLGEFGSVSEALKGLPPARRKQSDPGAPVTETQESATTDRKQVAESEGLPSRDTVTNDELRTEDDASGFPDRESPEPPDSPIGPEPEQQEGLATAENPPGRNGQHQMLRDQVPGETDKAETQDSVSLPPDGEVGGTNGSPMPPAEVRIHQLTKEPEEAQVEDGDDHPPAPIETQDAQEIERLRQELRQTRERLRETEDQLRETRDQLGEAEDRNSRLQAEVDRLRREREEKGRALKPLSFK